MLSLSMKLNMLTHENMFSIRSPCLTTEAKTVVSFIETQFVFGLDVSNTAVFTKMS